jgi:2'-5' RNA ligase
MHLGDHPGLPPGLEQAARQAAAALSGQAPFEVCFDRLENFRKGRDQHIQVLVTTDGAPALQAFHAALTTALQRAGLARWMDKRAGFTPHVSLQYSEQVAPPRAIEPVRWTVEGFVLVNSKIGRHEHHHLANWALQA